MCTVSEGGEEGELGRGVRVEVRHGRGAQDHGAEHGAARAEYDGRRGPGGDTLFDGHDEDAGVTLEAGAGGSLVEGPALDLLRIDVELYLDEDDEARVGYEQDEGRGPG
jgi:hypothetical protein